MIMEKHNVVEKDRTPGLEKQAETDIVDEAVAVFNTVEQDTPKSEDSKTCRSKTP